MDLVEFYTENREFKIRFKKEKRFYYLSEFGKYKITIEFINSINQIIFSINTTEKEFYIAAVNINNFIISAGSETDDIVNFNNNGDGTNYFLYIGLKYPYNSGPSEYDDLAELSFFHSTIQGNVLRLSFESSFYYLEEFIYEMYLILEDINYLDQIGNNAILEYIDNYEYNFPQ